MFFNNKIDKKFSLLISKIEDKEIDDLIHNIIIHIDVNRKSIEEIKKDYVFEHCANTGFFKDLFFLVSYCDDYYDQFNGYIELDDGLDNIQYYWYDEEDECENNNWSNLNLKYNTYLLEEYKNGRISKNSYSILIDTINCFDYSKKIKARLYFAEFINNYCCPI